MASVYFGRAALEIMRESAKHEELTIGLKKFDKRLAELLPHFKPIKTIRIQDFHRFGVLGPGYILHELLTKTGAFSR